MSFYGKVEQPYSAKMKGQFLFMVLVLGGMHYLFALSLYFLAPRRRFHAPRSRIRTDMHPSGSRNQSLGPVNYSLRSKIDDPTLY
uniref:Uncharacterized protein n=1 Tax=Triticum urartu TaxID=4572 RepID=A0A8R7V1K8_TRIUA